MAKQSVCQKSISMFCFLEYVSKHVKLRCHLCYARKKFPFKLLTLIRLLVTGHCSYFQLLLPSPVQKDKNI